MICPAVVLTMALYMSLGPRTGGFSLCGASTMRKARRSWQYAAASAKTPTSVMPGKQSKLNRSRTQAHISSRLARSAMNRSYSSDGLNGPPAHLSAYAVVRELPGHPRWCREKIKSWARLSLATARTDTDELLPYVPEASSSLLLTVSGVQVKLLKAGSAGLKACTAFWIAEAACCRLVKVVVVGKVTV